MEKRTAGRVHCSSAGRIASLANRPELLIPLIIASLIFGTVIGLASKKLKQT
jgi:hypothetical protein